jgi:hypothetical protein
LFLRGSDSGFRQFPSPVSLQDCTCEIAAQESRQQVGRSIVLERQRLHEKRNGQAGEKARHASVQQPATRDYSTEHTKQNHPSKGLPRAFTNLFTTTNNPEEAWNNGIISKDNRVTAIPVTKTIHEERSRDPPKSTTYAATQEFKPESMLDIVAAIKPEATKPVTPTGNEQITDQGYPRAEPSRFESIPTSQPRQHRAYGTHEKKTHKPSNDNNDNDITDTHAFNHKPRRALARSRAVK